MKGHTDEITLRMLGDNITLRRYQWVELAALLAPEHVWERNDAAELARRIAERLESTPVGAS